MIEVRQNFVGKVSRTCGRPGFMSVGFDSTASSFGVPRSTDLKLERFLRSNFSFFFIQSVDEKSPFIHYPWPEKMDYSMLTDQMKPLFRSQMEILSTSSTRVRWSDSVRWDGQSKKKPYDLSDRESETNRKVDFFGVDPSSGIS